MSYLLFTSSRDGVTEADVQAALWPRFAADKILVAGGARGGDRIAARLWREWGGQVDEHRVKPAEWQRSRGAGYRRNAEMVAKVKATEQPECVALIARCETKECPRQEPHGTHGAVHCAGIAQQVGIPVTRIKAGAQPEPEAALNQGGIKTAELDADEQIRAETVAWHQWNQAVLARQKAPEGAPEMTRDHQQDQQRELAGDQEPQAAFGGGPLPEHVTELEPGAYLIEQPVMPEAEFAAKQAEFLAWLYPDGRQPERDREPGS